MYIKKEKNGVMLTNPCDFFITWWNIVLTDVGYTQYMSIIQTDKQINNL
jgi:hypothetical protein